MTKQHFGIVTMTMTNWWAPVTIRVSGDESVRGQLKQTKDGSLELEFPERMVLVSNHQVCAITDQFRSFGGGSEMEEKTDLGRYTPTGSTSGGPPTPRACTATSTSSSKNPSNTSPSSARA
jgi:hypothetical protein